MNYNNSSIDIKDKVVSQQSHATNDVTCGGSLESPTHRLSKKIEKSIFSNLSLSNPTEGDRDFIFRDENDNVMVVDKTPGEKRYVWRKITSMDEYVSGEEYLFVHESNGIAFDGSLTTLDINNNVISVSINYGDYNEIEYNETTSNSSFTIADLENGGVSIYSKSGYYIGRLINANGMDTNTTLKYRNGIGFNNNGDVLISGTLNTSLQKNSSGNRFRYFRTSQQPIQLYKKTEVSVPDEYRWKTLVSNDDIDVITEEELDEILVPKCNDGNLKEECCDPITNNIIPCE